LLARATLLGDGPETLLRDRIVERVVVRALSAAPYLVASLQFPSYFENAARWAAQVEMVCGEKCQLVL
jgi:hypothetical protein